jgi:hypothetical protein
MKTRTIILNIMLLGALQANAWTTLNHDWTVLSPAGRIGLQEIERSGTALPNGKFTLLMLGPHEYYLSCGFYTASGIVILFLVAIALSIVLFVLKRTKRTKRKEFQQGGPAYPPQGVGSADP